MAGAMVTTNIMGTGVALGLATLREELALAMIANREYEAEITAAKRNSTVNIAVPAAVPTRHVAPDVVPPSVTATTPTSIPLTLTEWEEAPFAMDDKGLAQVDNGILGMQASEGIKSLANYIETFLWSIVTTSCYTAAGTSGVTPFGTDVSEYLAARAAANRNLMALNPRYAILDTNAEANALGLRAFQDASFGGGSDVILNGQIGRKLGALFLMSQLVPTHTNGTLTGSGTTVTGVNAVGATVIALSGGASGTLLASDIIQIGSYTYNVQSSVGSGTPSSVTIAPGLFAATSGGEVITRVGGAGSSFVQNLLIQRDALGFAMAPLLESVKVPGAGLQAVAIDEKSGLSLRLEVTRQHKQNQWSWDALFGGKGVRKGNLVYIRG